ncbi:MAG: hypothetical protein N4A59_14200 [Marinifilum sp.]|jgi:hypothetical protein|nr:hypothetical protein [Marinifilum sp.]
MTKVLEFIPKGICNVKVYIPSMEKKATKLLIFSFYLHGKGALFNRKTLIISPINSMKKSPATCATGDSNHHEGLTPSTMNDTIYN